MTGYRTSGGLVDRERVFAFSFDGQRMTGHPGDTLASALLANGRRLVLRRLQGDPGQWLHLRPPDRPRRAAPDGGRLPP
jgi:sarcosine oxidase subunit alpha